MPVRHRLDGRRLIAAALLLLLPGCYVSQPLSTPVPAPDTHIVAELSDQGTADMDRWLGAGAQRIDAVVASADSTTWRLRLLRVSRRNTGLEPWNGEVIPFPAAAFDSVVVRRLSRSRSYLTAAAFVAGAVLAARLFNLIGADSGGGGGTPVPPQ